jgi:hypothetical protein
VKRLKLYSDRSWLPPEREDRHVTALCPFWGRTAAGSASWPHYADDLIEHGREFLELTDLEDADVAVFPLGGRALLRLPDGAERARAFADAARALGKPTAFFFDNADTRGHLDPPFPVADAFVLRGSLFRSRRGQREHALPGFHDDLVAATGGNLPVRKKREPVVSFCGAVIPEHAAPRNARERARKVFGDSRRFIWRLQRRHEEDLFARSRAIDALCAQDDVATSIVVRESGGGGTWERFDEDRWNVARQEFLENMVDSDYVLCARGDGNWSIRFYEALCLGRIPIVIDTDLVMPYDSLVSWRDYGVWIDRSEIGAIGAKVAEYHERMGDAEFEDRQRECRRLWEEYLSPVGFFRHFHRHFQLEKGSSQSPQDASQ